METEYAPEDPVMCECGHDSDDHSGGTGSCDHVVSQFGPLGLHCECMMFHALEEHYAHGDC